jgi:hypothetical protein
VIYSAKMNGLRRERDDLAGRASRLDAYIVGDAFDENNRAGKVMVLRQHAALVWRLQELDDLIARHEDPAPCL